MRSIVQMCGVTQRVFMLLIFCGTVWCLATSFALAQAQVTLEFTSPQTAVLDPVDWDKTIPNALYFDAIRPLLVRFPGCAETIHARLNEGYRIDKVELVLEWQKQEVENPERGRGNWGANELYKANPGQWHVLVRPLRHPWSIDHPATGPTFNAYINGAGFWNRGGARGDGQDRSSDVFGPAPLYPGAPPPAAAPPAEPGGDAILANPLPEKAPTLTARLDVSKILLDPSYGKTLSDRLRLLDACGFQVQKQEIRDIKYRSFWAYDWAVSTGYMRIWVYAPKLIVTLQKDDRADKPGPLPPVIDIEALANTLRAKGGDGTPAITYPEDASQRMLAHLARPDGTPDWEWQRIQELRALGSNPNDVSLYLGRGYNFNTLISGDKDAYLASMRELLRMPPRFWQGHQTSDFAILAAGYSDVLPPAVADHLRLYWSAWLHPEVANRNGIGGGNQRGGPSYFRGYSNGGGTMNFGHNATMGAYLAGQFLNAPTILRDAREGINNIARGGFGFGTGAHQEIGDTYYQALTIGALGALSKFTEDPIDRLRVRIERDRLLEPLMSMYHPGLRRMTHPMGRGSYTYHLLLQEGSYHILHTLSPNGALLHLRDLKTDRTNVPASWGSIHGLSIIGDEGPPLRIGLLSPWTDSYLADTYAAVVDGKTLPARIFARDYSPGCRSGWHVNFLGRSYALASRDNANHDYGVTSVVGQWRRKAEQVGTLDDLSTLLLSFDRNAHYPEPYVNPAEFGIVQRDNKLVALKALPNRTRFGEKPPTLALQSTVAIISFGDVSQREVWINDRKIDAVSGAKADPGGDWTKRISTGLTANATPLPADPDDKSVENKIPQPAAATNGVALAQDGDIITIKDGVTYIGLIPLVVNPLERSRQVEISYEYPTLQIHAFMYYGATPLDLNRYFNTPTPSTAGFVVEMGDVADYPSFDAFRAHMRQVKLATTWNADKKMVEVQYASGPDVLTMGFDPARYPAVYRTVNGQWPYLPDGIMRESSWAIQGSTGHLEKLGAILETAPNHHAYLEAVPATDTYIGYNPLPDPMPWALSVPGGITVKANGKLGLARVTVRPKTNSIWIDYGMRATQTDQDTATALQVVGMAKAPIVYINNAPYTIRLETQVVDGKTIYVIPLPAPLP
ncbi:MAG: hypothetical protein ACYDBB_00405 [Armatimonadota bacterium]